MNRRNLLMTTGAALVALALPGARVALAKWDPLATATTFGHDLMPATIEPVEKTDAEWRQSLSDAAYAVLRQHGTEYAFTSDLLNEKRTGTYACAGCDLALYRSETKFDSRTGWPSFYEAIKGAVGTQTDFKLIYPRTEVHCIRCKGHQGHIFDDGPQPTGNRHCINGVALKFIPDENQSG